MKGWVWLGEMGGCGEGGEIGVVKVEGWGWGWYMYLSSAVRLGGPSGGPGSVLPS